ncbi:MAG: F0F1 ATP synthase subunit delta [Armatimonadota bacterium]
MINRKAAKRYARALFEYARDTDAVEAMQRDLSTVCDLLKTTPEFDKFLAHPLIPEEEKRRVVEEALGAVVSGAMLGFVHLLIEHDRTDTLPAVMETYNQLADGFRGIVRARVESAVPLTDEERAAIAARIAAYQGRTPVLDVRVDPDLLGGVRIQIGHCVIDGTLRTSLDVMRERLQRVSLKAAG